MIDYCLRHSELAVHLLTENIYVIVIKHKGFDIEGSKTTVAMNTWLPFKVFISVGSVGYPGVRV